MVFIRAHAQCEAAVVADFLAFFDLVRAFDMIDDGEDDVRDIGFRFLREIEHALVRRFAVFRARELVVARGIRGVQADGDRVEHVLKLRRDILAVFEIREAVRIEPRRQLRLDVLDVMQELYEHIEAHRRLAEAAEDDFLEILPRHGVERSLEFLDARLPVLVPER